MYGRVHMRQSARNIPLDLTLTLSQATPSNSSFITIMQHAIDDIYDTRPAIQAIYYYQHRPTLTSKTNNSSS